LKPVLTLAEPAKPHLSIDIPRRLVNITPPKPTQPASNKRRRRLSKRRIAPPGIQALFGFQLMAVFNNRFNNLKSPEQVLHLSALLLVAVAIALIMTPASFHRIAEKGVVSRRFVELGSRLRALAMIPLMFGLSIELFIVARLVLTNVSVSVTIVAALLSLFCALWYILPWVERRAGRASK
jgi:hypothetical protein